MTITCTIETADQAVIGTFPCMPGQTVLEAAGAAGWQLPHSCLRGVCETCRAPLQGGTVEAGPDADGTVLLCRAKPVTDLRIAPVRAERIAMESTRKITAKVYRVRMPAPDVAVVDLRFPAGVRLRFRSGQFLQVQVPDGQARSFSIATPARSSDAVQLHVRVLPGGLFGSRIVPALQAGDTLEVEAPFGDFYLREGTRPVVMVAGGTGFAPMQSILEQALAADPKRSFTLYWGARDPSGLYAMDLVRRWQQRHANFSFSGVISGEPPAAPLRAGLVHEAVLADFGSLADADVYVCGAPPMVHAAREAFTLQRGLPAASFFSDAFAPALAPATSNP